MEPSWSPVVATGGNRSQTATPQKHAKTVAVSCDGKASGPIAAVVDVGRGLQGAATGAVPDVSGQVVAAGGAAG
jgi:hypothetical protein